MYKFRVIVGSHICTPAENLISKKEFSVSTLKRARQYATNYAKFYDACRQVSWNIWIKGGKRRTLRQTRSASHLEIWLVSLDIDIKDLP